MPGQIVRHKKTDSYTIIPNALARDFTLSAKARGVLIAILSLPEDWDLNVSKLIEWSREGEEAIYNALKELEKAGYISRFREHDEKGRKSRMSYIVRDKPDPDSPDLDFPVRGYPGTTKDQQSQSTKGTNTPPSSKGEDCKAEMTTGSQGATSDA